MESSEEFELHKKREIGEIISDGIEFVKLNLSEILTGYIYHIVPWMLVATGLSYLSGGHVLSYLNVAAEDITSDKLMATGVFYFMMMIAYMIAYGLIFSIFIKNDPSIKDKDSVSFSMLNISLKLSGFYLVVFGLFFFMVGLLGFLLFQIAPFLVGILGIIFFIGFIYLLVPLSISPYIYVKEGLGVLESVKRSMDIVEGHWGSAFFVIIIASIISTMCSYLILIPCYVLSFALGFSLEDFSSGNLQGWIGTVILFITALASILVNMYTIVCVVLKYYDLIEHKEGTRMQKVINEIGNQKDSFFENEGEF